jgi:hypothetical protein
MNTDLFFSRTADTLHEMWLVPNTAHLTVKSFVLITLTGWHIYIWFSIHTPLGWVRFSSCPAYFSWVGWLQAVPARGPHSCATAATCSSRVGNLVSDWKWHQILPSLISDHEWQVLSHVVIVQHGVSTLCYRFLLPLKIHWLSRVWNWWWACYH